jgi:RecB family exonuclease
VQQVLEEARKSKQLDAVAILRRYDELWATTAGPHVLIVKPGMTLEDYRAKGRLWVRNYLDRLWNVVNGTPIHLEEELRFAVELADGTRTVFRGTPDRVDRLQDGRLRLIDYKTGSYIPKFVEDRDKYQLALYWRALLEKYPDTPGGVLVWEFLQHGETRRHDPEPALIASAQAWVRTVTAEIRSRLESSADPAQRFPAKPSKLCQWCEFGYACGPNPYKAAAPAPRPGSTEAVAPVPVPTPRVPSK